MEVESPIKSPSRSPSLKAQKTNNDDPTQKKVYLQPPNANGTATSIFGNNTNPKPTTINTSKSHGVSNKRPRSLSRSKNSPRSGGGGRSNSPGLKRRRRYVLAEQALIDHCQKQIRDFEKFGVYEEDDEELEELREERNMQV